MFRQKTLTGRYLPFWKRLLFGFALSFLSFLLLFLDSNFGFVQWRHAGIIKPPPFISPCKEYEMKLAGFTHKLQQETHEIHTLRL